MSIGGFARRLQEKFPGLREADIILKESQRLGKILGRIRDYLKPVEIQPRKCSVNDLLRDCVDLLSPELTSRGIRCRLELTV
ncbi:MAG: hypothetical protein KKH85_02510 [Proteobacteria bacterium]|nr:hypothetical protein [Pseudomonadota bacterium]